MSSHSLVSLSSSSTEYQTIRKEFEYWINKLQQMYEVRLYHEGVVSIHTNDNGQPFTPIDLSSPKLYELYQLVPHLFEKTISVRNLGKQSSSSLKDQVQTYAKHSQLSSLEEVSNGELILVLMSLWTGFKPIEIRYSSNKNVVFHAKPTTTLQQVCKK